MMEIFARLIGQITKSACCAFCGSIMELTGSNSNRARTRTDLRTLSSDTLRAIFPHSIPYQWKLLALRFNVRSGVHLERFLVEIRSAMESLPNRSADLRPCEP